MMKFSRLFMQSMLCFPQISDRFHDSDYLHVLTDNNGIAAPKPLTKIDLEKQFDLIMTAPNDQNMTLHRGRFKAGHLQLLTSFDQTCNDTTKQVRFWWNVDLYKDTDDLIKHILSDRKMTVTGSPGRFYKSLYM